MNRSFPPLSSGISSVSRSVFTFLLIAVLVLQVLFAVPARQVKASGLKPEPVSVSSPPEPFHVSGSEFGVSSLFGSMLALIAPATKTEPVKMEPAEPPTAASPAATFLPSADAAGLAALRLDPKNATGGTNLYSRNFAWGTSLVGLPGRAGLDAGFGISYNSLVWLKDTTNNQIIFDPDTSNVSPGFRMGFPTIEQPYYDSTKGVWVFLVINPDGSRTEFSQISSGLTFEPGDSSYRKLVISAGGKYLSGSPQEINITVTSTDGTQI